MIRSAGIKYKAMIAAESPGKEPNKDLEGNETSRLLNEADHVDQPDITDKETVSSSRVLFLTKLILCFLSFHEFVVSLFCISMHRGIAFLRNNI